VVSQYVRDREAQLWPTACLKLARALVYCMVLPASATKPRTEFYMRLARKLRPYADVAVIKYRFTTMATTDLDFGLKDKDAFRQRRAEAVPEDPAW
jgi:hypothetical protein